MARAAVSSAARASGRTISPAYQAVGRDDLTGRPEEEGTVVVSHAPHGSDAHTRPAPDESLPPTPA